MDESQNRPVPVDNDDAFMPRDGLACTFWDTYVLGIDSRHRTQPNPSRTEPYGLARGAWLVGLHAALRPAETTGWPPALASRSVEGGRKQVAGSNAAVRPPFLSNCQHLGLAREVVELVGTPDSLSQCKVTREDHVLSSQREDQRALSGPWANPGDRRKLGNDLVVGQVAQSTGVQTTVGEPLGHIAQGDYLSPRQTSLAKAVSRHAKQFCRGR